MFISTISSAEFTDLEELEQSDVVQKELVPVEPFQACTKITNAAQVQGKVAFIQRGQCNFADKVLYAQEAGAVAAVVMDDALRDESPHHIIMQKDRDPLEVDIPAVFVAYSEGEKLMLSIHKALPWNPVLVTVDEEGELLVPPNQSTNVMLRRALVYVFVVSVVCVFSSGLSLISSALFAWMARTGRAKAAKRLPVMTYAEHFHPVATNISSDGDETIGHNKKAKQESCVICLDDYEDSDTVKVLPCNHCFHVNCINPWLEGRSSRCPLCKCDAIASVSAAPKCFFGFTVPRIDQIVEQEHYFHAFFLMLPASVISCLILNTVMSIVRSTWG